MITATFRLFSTVFDQFSLNMIGFTQCFGRRCVFEEPLCCACVGDISSKDEILRNLGEFGDVPNVGKLFCGQVQSFVNFCQWNSTIGEMQNVDIVISRHTWCKFRLFIGMGYLVSFAFGIM